MADNDFSILLQALLDENASISNINSNIKSIQKSADLNKIQIKAILDQSNMNHITEQIAKTVNQKISISGIDMNQGQINKSVQQVVNGVHSSWSKTLNGMKHDINSIVKSLDNEKNKLSSYNLTKLFNLDRGKIDSSVIQQVRSLTKELNSLGREAVKTNSDSAWEGIATKISSLSQVLTKFGSSRDLAPFKESLDILNYFQNKKIFAGNNSEVLSNTGMNVKELNNQFRNLGITFTTVSGNATKLDTVWSELCNISPNLQQFSSFGDQISAVVEHLKTAKDVLQSDRYLQPLNGNEVSSELVRWMTNIEELAKRASILREEYSELEKASKTSSASAANTVIQNEEKKQQAYKETAQIQKQLAKGESLIKYGANMVTFENTNNAAREAAATFKELLKDENAVISVSERFDKSNGLASFTVNVKRAAGEVESLRYALEPLKDMNGNLAGEFKFINKGAELNNAGAIRQTQAVENAFSQYTAKLEQFKSTNNNILSGLSVPLADFENKLSSLRNGTVTVNELKNSFRMLKAESSKITSNLSGDLNKVDKAVRSIAKGKETISGLRAEFKGLSSTPKEINSELNNLTAGLQNIKKIESQEGRTANWSKAYREWEQAVDSLRAKLRVLIKEQANAASTQIFKTSDLRKANIPYMTKVSNTTEKQMAEIQKMAHAHGWQSFDVKGVEQADGLIKRLTLTVTDAEGALKKLNFQREKLQGNGKAQFGLMQTGDIQVLKTASQAQEELAQKAAHANEKLDEQRTKLANKIQFSLETGGYESKVESLISRTRQWTNEQGNARISTEALSKAFQNLNAAHDALAKNNTAANQQALINAEKELDIQIKKVTNSVRTMNAQLAKDSTISSLHHRIQEFYDKNSAAHSKWGTQLKRMLSETASGAKLTHEQVRRLSAEFNNVGTAARQAGRLGKSFTQTLREGMKSFSYWTSSTFLVMKTIQSIKKAVTTVKELDTALVDLKKTTTMTASQLEDFYYNANDVAKQMGVTTNEIISQAAAWSRLGFQSADAATKMAKYSAMFKLISPGMDLDSATNGLVSIMKAFKIGLEDTDEVVDGIMSKINIIGNSKALNNSDIVDFLTRSSSALSSANNSIEESIAMGEAIVEITRDAAGAGQVMKTTSMRIRGYDEELEAYTDDMENLKGKIADLTKTAQTPGGISLFTDSTKETYKSTYKILEEISGIWDDLTDKNQAELLEVLAGKRNGQALAALISNFDSARESIELMAGSTGNADAELSVTMDSIEYRLNRLKETWGTGIAQNLFEREDMKSLLDFLTKLGEGFDALTSKIGLFGTIGVGAGVIGIRQFVKNFA